MNGKLNPTVPKMKEILPKIINKLLFILFNFSDLQLDASIS